MDHLIFYALLPKIKKKHFHMFPRKDLLVHCIWVLAPVGCNWHRSHRKGPSYKFTSNENSTLAFQLQWLKRNHTNDPMNLMQCLLFHCHYRRLLLP